MAITDWKNTEKKLRRLTNMDEYVKQAKDFLKSCNATMDIMYLGTEVNKNWDEKRE